MEAFLRIRFSHHPFETGSIKIESTSTKPQAPRSLPASEALSAATCGLTSRSMQPTFAETPPPRRAAQPLLRAVPSTSRSGPRGP